MKLGQGERHSCVAASTEGTCGHTKPAAGANIGTPQAVDRAISVFKLWERASRLTERQEALVITRNAFWLLHLGLASAGTSHAGEGLLVRIPFLLAARLVRPRLQ